MCWACTELLLGFCWAAAVKLVLQGAMGVWVCSSWHCTVACYSRRFHHHSSYPTPRPEPPAQVLQRTVPPAVPGIMFLSGGQSEEASTLHLALMNQAAGRK